MFLGFNQSIWYYQFPIDFRKQVDGLVLLIADKLERDPVSGQLFIFRNRQSNKLKLLWWDHHGFWLLYRRIEKGRFKLPAMVDQVIEINADQLGVLLAGIDFKTQHYFEKVTASKFY